MSTVVRMGLGPSTELDDDDSPTLPSHATLATLTPKPDLDVNCPFSPPNPDTENTEAIALDDLANLPPLPSQSPNEIQDLDPNYPNYRAMIHYYTLSPSSTLTQETHPTYVSRKSVILSLEYFYILRKHLTANLAILETYPGTSLVGGNDTETTPSNNPWETTVTDVVSPNAHTQSDSRRDSSFEPEVQKTATRKSSSFTELERVQNEFAMHHIAINENLRAANSGWACQSFGLPDPIGAASDIRHDRNFFAHSFPIPMGRGIQLEWAVKSKAVVYGKLLGFVEGGICALQSQLDNPSIWVSLESLEKESVRREAREEKERLVVEGAEQEDDKEGVYEGVEEVDWMDAPQSMFSRIFDCSGGNAVSRYCFRFGVVRNAGSRLWAWLGEMLEEADAVALRKAGEKIAREYGEGQVLAEASTATRFRGEEGVPAEYGEGDDWKSQEYKSEYDDCGSQEYKIEDGEGYGSQDMNAHLSRPDSGWGDPQW